MLDLWTAEASTWPSRTSVPASPSPLYGSTTSAALAWAATWPFSLTWWRGPTLPPWWRSEVSVWTTLRKGTRQRCTAVQRASGWFPLGGVCAQQDLKSTEILVLVSHLTRPQVCLHFYPGLIKSVWKLDLHIWGREFYFILFFSQVWININPIKNTFLKFVFCHFRRVNKLVDVWS